MSLQRSENIRYLHDIITARMSGSSCLPLMLGLDSNSYTQLTETIRRGYVSKGTMLSESVNDELYFSADELAEDTRQELLELRQQEWKDLFVLLLEHKKGSHYTEVWLAAIISAACLGSEHLWRDLGLTCREDLNQLLMLNFPCLAEKNTKDMKWKKFFYKQLCEQQGSYLCRSPSCESCSAYDDCFGEED